MNKKGHSKSLVPAQPGNTNAVKTGVFSPRVLAPLIAEAEAQLAAQPPTESVREVLRHELAALVTLGEAMDGSLEQDGIKGRGGEPRSLIDKRLRLNDRLRRTLEQYVDVAADASAVGEPGESATPNPPDQLIVTVSRLHYREPTEVVGPADFDAETFLKAVVVTDDPAVTFDDRVLAQRLLTRRGKERAKWCTCSATLVARQEFELRGWIDEARSAGVQPHEGDAFVASQVRRVSRGERLEPWALHKRTWYAIEETVRNGARRLRGAPEEQRQVAEARDPAMRFWKTLLGRATRISPRQRLKAFSALDEGGAFRTCSCRKEEKERLPELEADAGHAYVIRSVGQRHYRAAMVIAAFPETYYAVRDAIDERAAADEPAAAAGTSATKAGGKARQRRAAR